MMTMTNKCFLYSKMKSYHNALTFAITGLAVVSSTALAIDNLLPPARKLVPADTASTYCDGLKGQAKGLCLAYNSGVKSDKAKATLAANYLQEFGEVMPGSCGMMPGLEPFPDNNAFLRDAVDAYISGTWNGTKNNEYYGYT
jgi:hypothetical protein